MNVVYNKLFIDSLDNLIRQGRKLARTDFQFKWNCFGSVYLNWYEETKIMLGFQLFYDHLTFLPYKLVNKKTMLDFVYIV